MTQKNGKHFLLYLFSSIFGHQNPGSLFGFNESGFRIHTYDLKFGIRVISPATFLHNYCSKFPKL
jgi:hypothetical protein